MFKRMLRFLLILIVGIAVASFSALYFSEFSTGKPTVTLPESSPENSELDDRPTNVQPFDVVDVTKAEYSYTEMVEDIESLAELSQGRLTYKSIGRSLDGRTLYALVLGNQQAKKQIVISAGIHAREYMTPMLVMKQVEYYLYNYDTGKYNGVSFADIFEEYAFCIMPMCNPDGITLVQEGVEGIHSSSLRQTVIDIYNTDKKNIDDFADMTIDQYLRYWKANARGVDLNRNFDTPAWDSNNVRKPCFSDCRGEGRLSEPESRAMSDYVKSLSNPVCSVAMHSRGEVIFFDCGQDDKRAAHELASLISGINGYKVSYDPRSVAAFDDWCMIEKNIPSVTVETGVETCPLPIGEFAKIWENNRDLWAAIASSKKY